VSADVVEEQPGEMAPADACQCRQATGGEVGVEVTGDVVDDPSYQPVLGWGRGDEHAHLGLVTRPLQVPHQGPGHHPGDVDAVVLLDEAERQVKGAGHPGGRVDTAVADVDGVGVDLDGRVPGREPSRIAPVGSGPPPV
jgi:hypothetical protein